MEALFVSTGIVALAEIGDKTQLLALVLAARYRAPLAISIGILLATLANHALAGMLGSWVAGALGPDLLRWLLAASFIGMGLWTLIPDKLDDASVAPARHGVLIATLVAFFLAEMGDKTQFATVALAANFDALWWVVLGTTLGMMLANVPVVLFGHAAAHRLPTRLVHRVAALLFIGLGLLALFDARLGALF